MKREREATPEPEPEPEEEEAEESSGKLKVLVVADDRLTLLFSKRVFCDKTFNDAFEVLAADSGVAAWTMLKDSEENPKFDLLCTDFQVVGKISGLELLKKVKADLTTKDLPVVVVSASLDKRDSCIAEGAAYVIQELLKVQNVAEILKILKGQASTSGAVPPRQND